MKFNIEVDHEQLNKILSACNSVGEYQITIDLCEQAGIGKVAKPAGDSLDEFMELLSIDAGPSEDDINSWFDKVFQSVDDTTEVSDLTFHIDTSDAQDSIYAIVDALDDLEEAYDRVSKKTGLV